jgi:ATP-dependent exoDNAse (exonuclease V) beta subunit
MAHISYSEFKDMCFCPWKHKISWIDRIRTSSVYAVFGTAVHETLDQIAKNKLVSVEEQQKYFEESFSKNISELSADVREKISEKILIELTEQGRSLVPLVMPALYARFGNFTILNSEEPLFEQIKEVSEKIEGFCFKGFVDLIIRDPSEIIHVLDFKSCAWGWDIRRRTDTMVTYQLTLYKHFYAQKYNLDIEKIKTGFILLKRTAKKDRVEYIPVTSGAKKTENAMNMLTTAVYNIHRNIRIKNRLSCSKCDFYKTIHCP